MPTGVTPKDQLTLISRSEKYPEAAFLARTALRTPALGAQSAQTATLAALAATPAGPLNQLLAQIAAEAILRSQDTPARMAVGRTYLEALEGQGCEKAHRILQMTTMPSGEAASAQLAALSQLLPSESTNSRQFREQLTFETDPGRDFDRFANGRWCNQVVGYPGLVEEAWNLVAAVANRVSGRQVMEPRVKTPAGLLMRISEADLGVRDFIRRVLKQSRSAPVGSALHQLKAFHDSATDRARSKSGLGRLGRILDQLQSGENLAVVLARAHRLGIDIHFAVETLVENEGDRLFVPRFNPTLKIDPGIFTRAESFLLRQLYLDYMKGVFEDAGDASEVAHQRAQRAFAVEQRLSAHFPNAEEIDQAIQEEVAFQELSQRFPGVDWKQYGRTSLKGYKGKVLVNSPAYFEALAAEVAGGGQEVRDYLSFRLLDATATVRTPQSERRHFAFYTEALSGPTKYPSEKSRVQGLLRTHLSEVLSRQYSEEHLTPALRARVEGLFAQLKEVLARRIEASELSPEGKAAAQRKLAHMTLVLGPTEENSTLKGVEFDAGDLFENVCRVREREVERIVDRFGRPGYSFCKRVGEVGLEPNAFYRFTSNSVALPATFFQPPSYFPDQDEASFYGTVGTVLGHEISHGLDPNNIQFGPEGERRPLWRGPDAKWMNERMKTLVDHAESFDTGVDEKLEGEQVVGEVVADLGGVSLAFEAFQEAIAGKPRTRVEGLTPEQRFFVWYAQGQAAVYSEESLRKHLKNGTHPPAGYRVNGILSQLPSFAAAFGIEPTAPLASEESKRAPTW